MAQPPQEVLEISCPSDDVILLRIIGTATFHDSVRERFCIDLRRTTIEVRPCEKPLLRTIHEHLWEIVDHIWTFDVARQDAKLVLFDSEKKCEIIRRCRMASHRLGFKSTIRSRTATPAPVAV